MTLALAAGCDAGASEAEASETLGEETTDDETTGEVPSGPFAGCGEANAAGWHVCNHYPQEESCEVELHEDATLWDCSPASCDTLKILIPEWDPELMGWGDWDIAPEDLATAQCVLDVLGAEAAGAVDLHIGWKAQGSDVELQVFTNGDATAQANIRSEQNSGECAPGYQKSDRLTLRTFAPECSAIGSADQALDCLGLNRSVEEYGAPEEAFRAIELLGEPSPIAPECGG